MGDGVGIAASMFWFAWTANFDSVHWVVPSLAGASLSASMMLIFVSFLTCEFFPCLALFGWLVLGGEGGD